MRPKMLRRWILNLCILGSLIPLSVVAQALRYVDEAGNIHFAESLKQVPRQYREQIVPPTPTPVLDRRALQEKKRLEMEAMRKKEVEEQFKRREELRRENEARQQRDRERRRLKDQEQAGGFTKGGL